MVFLHTSIHPRSFCSCGEILHVKQRLEFSGLLCSKFPTIIGQNSPRRTKIGNPLLYHSINCISCSFPGNEHADSVSAPQVYNVENVKALGLLIQYFQVHSNQLIEFTSHWHGYCWPVRIPPSLQTANTASSDLV